MRIAFVAFCASLMIAGVAHGAAAPVTPGPGPQQLIDSVSREMLHEVDANRAVLAKDPAKLRALVNRVLLPHFDTEYSARLVLGRYWRDATAQQRQRFIEGFIQSMMRQYGDALLDFTADRLVLLPFKGDPAAATATVRTEVKRDNGTPVPVNYSMHATPEGWKAWDVTIEGVSYVKNFKTDFGAEIEAKGLEAVIHRLETENAAPAAPAKPGAKAG
ncbi:MAG: ABC transporter substrate-binding protein [Steroidobacteraceae bacterium]